MAEQQQNQSENQPQEQVKPLQPIIKRVKKIAAGHHGGTWKIAYADFMATMMTFFLVMWLISQIPNEKRTSVAEYFKHFKFFPIIQKTGDKVRERGYQVKQKTVPLPVKTNIRDIKELRDKFKDTIEQKLNDLAKNIALTITDEGVRIEIIDNEGYLMFSQGSPVLKTAAKRIIRELAVSLVDIDNKIIIEGHADSQEYKSGFYTNWELSTERASAARREFEENGFSPERLAMVAGYSDTKPLIAADTSDPRNRRISIVVLYPQAEPTQQIQEKPQIIEAVQPIIEPIKTGVANTGEQP